MTYQELAKQNFPNCILPREEIVTGIFGSKVMTQLYTREHDSMSLKQFLGNDFFVTNWNSVSIGKKLTEIYQDDTYEFFVSSNLLPSEVSIKDLKFYQDEINLDRLDKIGSNITYLDEPVLIIKDGDELILYNGYHRITINLLNDKSFINGFILNVS